MPLNKETKPNQTTRLDLTEVGRIETHAWSSQKILDTVDNSHFGGHLRRWNDEVLFFF